MIISVKNYKNIESLDLELVDSKINFLFGISGSGKSSLSEAIRKVDIDVNTKVGKKQDDFYVSIDGNDPDNSRFEVFDLDSIKDYVINEIPSKKGYELVIQDDSKIKSFQQNYKNSVDKLAALMPDIYDIKKNINQLQAKIGGKLTKENHELHKSAKIFTVSSEISKINDVKVYSILFTRGTEYIDWIKKGTQFPDFEKASCPFCYNTLSKEIIEQNLQMANLTISNLKHIFDTSEIFSKFNLVEPNYSDENQILAFADKIRDIQRMEYSLDKIISLYSFTNSIEVEPNDLVELVIDEYIYEFIPNLKGIIDDINSRVIELKDIVIEFKKECSRKIKENLSTINEEIGKLGISYKIKEHSVESESQQASYILHHIKDLEKLNRSSKLSFGEKNIIALLLFIITNKEKTLIIDDPVSSFDDFRRKQILDLIYRYSDNRTIIVFSHDHIFAKFVSYEIHAAMKNSGTRYFSERNRRYLDLTGICKTFENYNGFPICKLVNYDDFQTMESHVIKNIKMMKSSTENYYRFVLNLRLLIEPKKNDAEKKLIYEYTSAILHKIERDEIIKLLEERNTTEEEVLKSLRVAFPEIKMCIRPIPIGYLDVIDTSDWSFFEKALEFRERCNDKTIKDELNNLAHMNDSLLISLNPYEFNYFSGYLYENIKE